MHIPSASLHISVSSHPGCVFDDEIMNSMSLNDTGITGNSSWWSIVLIHPSVKLHTHGGHFAIQSSQLLSSQSVSGAGGGGGLFTLVGGAFAPQ